MPPEIIDEKKEEPKEVVQLSADEERAQKNGWKPKAEWEGDLDDWVPAKQFNKNGELFGRINTYKHKITHLENSVNALVKHNEKVFDAGYKAAEQNLKAQRKEALQSGDHEAVAQIEDQLEEIQEEHKKQKETFVAEVKPNAQTPHPSWEAWVENNNWYAKDAALRGYADGIALEITTETKEAGKAVDFDRLLVEVERKVKEAFPNKFGGNRVTNTVKDDSREGAGNVRRAKKDDVEAQMSDEEIQIMNVILKTGVKKEKYLEDYKKVQSRGR